MMRCLLSRIVLISWAMLFGGNIALFVFISALFRERHDIAGVAGGTIFPAFERLAIPTAAVLLIGLAAIRLMNKRAAATVAFVLVGLASVTLVISTMFVTPKIIEMRLAGQTKTEQFRTTHKRSMLLYVSQAGLLLMAGLVLPGVISSAPRQDHPVML